MLSIEMSDGAICSIVSTDWTRWLRIVIRQSLHQLVSMSSSETLSFCNVTSQRETKAGYYHRLTGGGRKEIAIRRNRNNFISLFFFSSSNKKKKKRGTFLVCVAFVDSGRSLSLSLKTVFMMLEEFSRWTSRCLMEGHTKFFVRFFFLIFFGLYSQPAQFSYFCRIMERFSFSILRPTMSVS